jgi:hypothetical protein
MTWAVQVPRIEEMINVGKFWSEILKQSDQLGQCEDAVSIRLAQDWDKMRGIS